MITWEKFNKRPINYYCACTRLKRRAPARLGAAATNCGPCPRPLCITALQASGAGAGGSPGACTMRAPATSSMVGTAPLIRGLLRPTVQDGHPSRPVVAQAGFPAVGPRGAAGAARARRAGLQRAQGACWRAFWCGMWGMSMLSDEACARERVVYWYSI